jgi:hypothetical protein
MFGIRDYNDSAHTTYQVTMLLRRNPEVSVAPLAEFPKLYYLGVIVLYIILDRESNWIVYAHIAT